jgi:hypothetical protein
VRADGHAARRLFRGEAGADREAAAQTLGRRQDVGRDAILLIGIERANPADAALHLVKRKQQVMFVGTACAGLP